MILGPPLWASGAWADDSWADGSWSTELVIQGYDIVPFDLYITRRKATTLYLTQRVNITEER